MTWLNIANVNQGSPVVLYSITFRMWANFEMAEKHWGRREYWVVMWSSFPYVRFQAPAARQCYWVFISWLKERSDGFHASAVYRQGYVLAGTNNTFSLLEVLNRTGLLHRGSYDIWTQNCISDFLDSSLSPSPQHLVLVDGSTEISINNTEIFGVLLMSTNVDDAEGSSGNT